MELSANKPRRTPLLSSGKTSKVQEGAHGKMEMRLMARRRHLIT